MMSMKRFLIFVFCCVTLLWAGCSGSKSYSNKARKLQEAGLNEEAAAFYLQALQRNPKNVDAKIGLKTTGQIQIEKSLTSFYKAYSVSNYKEAVYKYQEALSFSRQYGNFVNIEIPPYYNDYYQEMLVVYLAERYETAGDLLYDENFKEAKVIYVEILRLDPEYKDVKELDLQSTIEPLYRQGVVSFEADKFRKCYGIMEEVLAKKSHYKDAIDYKERALEEGQVTVAVLAFQSTVPNKQNVVQSIQSSVVSGIIKVNDPFIKVLDRSNMDDLIAEQKINVKGDAYGNSAIKAGELLGANMLIQGKLINYSYREGKISQQLKQGFESYQVKKTDSETKKTYYQTYYKRVNYIEYQGTSTMHAEVQYQLVSAETGEVVKSDVLRQDKSDNVNFVAYKGNYKNLYAGKYIGSGSKFQKGDVIYSSSSQKQSLRQKVTTSKRTLQSEQQLASGVLGQISKSIVRGVTYFNTDEL